jgi:hypothetical protein
VAREHLDAELVLERADLLRDAGLLGVQRFGGLGNVEAPPHHLGEIAKLLEFHAVLLRAGNFLSQRLRVYPVFLPYA